MPKLVDPHVKEQVIALRESGATYKEIFEKTGVGCSTVSRWTVPGSAERQRAAIRKYGRKNRSTVRGMLKNRINAINHNAKANGYAGVSAELDEVVEVWEQSSGKCQCCGRDSDDLVLEHCHDTGGIRGFVCRWCNNLIACVENGHVQKVMDFLKATYNN